MYYRLLFFLLGVLLFSCSKDDPFIDISKSEYPAEVGKIILTKCATSGCHTSQSKSAASGLDLSSWEKAFEGGNSGSVVVPYSHRFSTMFLYTNTHSDLGGMAEPTMPLNGTPLSREEMITLKNWIDNGAPNSSGEIKFSGSNLRKAYVVNQGCDVVAVLDPSTGLTMRYVECGNNPAIESPHNVKVSPDGQFWYVSFLGSDFIQKFRTSNDQLVGEIPFIGPNDTPGGSWNTFSISPDSKKAYATDINLGRIAVIDLENMTRISTYAGFANVHGSALNKNGDTLYVAAQTGNFIYKIPVNDFSSFEEVSLDGTFPTSFPGEDPHEILFTSDGSKYFVTCQGTNEVKVLRTIDDAVINTFQVSFFPQEMAVSEEKNLLIVTHPEDQNSFPGKRGSVSIIDLSGGNITTVFPGFQPHGLAIDHKNGKALIANRNVNPTGPAPHHTTDCGGRNGYLTFLDLTSFEISEKRIELSSDPYFISIRE